MRPLDLVPGSLHDAGSDRRTRGIGGGARQEPSPMPSVAQVIVDTLEAAGVRRCYGIPGDTLNHVTDAIRTSQIRWVHVRHEEAAGFAAGADAMLTGELAACAG